MFSFKLFFSDVRLPCTLWGVFAEQVLKASQEACNRIVVCLIRFAKIQKYKGIWCFYF